MGICFVSSRESNKNVLNNHFEFPFCQKFFVIFVKKAVFGAKHSKIEHTKSCFVRVSKENVILSSHIFWKNYVGFVKKVCFGSKSNEIGHTKKAVEAKVDFLVEFSLCVIKGSIKNV
jgi:hypothetical protein